MTYSFSQPFPNFDLGEYILRELSIDDAEDYFYYLAHPQVSRFIPANNCPSSIQEAIAELRYWGGLFRESRGFYWGIAEKTSYCLIGTVGFNVLAFHHLRAELSYDLSYDYWGKGIMTKALKQVITFSEEVLKLIRLQAVVSKTNHNSTKLLRRLGFTQEGILKQYERFNGVNYDAVMFAKILNN